jgi:F-type H+-transporting ATPase subunit b
MRRYLIAGLSVVLVTVVVLNGPARAESKAEQGHTTAEEKGADKDHKPGEGHERPPMFGSDIGIWTLLIFLAVFGILYWKAWPLVLEGLQKREHNIASALEDARKAREEAEVLRGQFKKELDNAQEKVRGIMDEGRKNAESNAQAIVDKAKGEMQADRERLHREIDLAKDQALKEIWTQTAQLATMVSEKTIRRHLTPDDHRRLIDEAIADLRRSVEDRRERTDGQSA